MSEREPTFADRYGPWAVVTGAAAGVGLAYTEALTARGLGVVMVDKDESVAAVAAAIDGDTRSLVADVADSGWIDAVALAAAGLEIGLAVANAGVSFVGRYLDMTPVQRRAILDINCAATAELASWALPPMVRRGRGGFVCTSSGSALAGTAGVALYSASKAFAVNLMEALGWELRNSGVETLAVVAPSMDTPAFRSSGPDPARMLGEAVDPRLVVEGALDALPEGGRWLGDPGLQFVVDLPRGQAVDVLGSATTGMYPHIFER